MTALRRTHLSVSAASMPGGEINRPVVSCFGIDITERGGAPGDELLRIDVSAVHNKASRLRSGFSLLGEFLPSVIRSGEQVLVCHDLENTGIILATIPSDANDFDRIDHTESLHAASDASHGSGLRDAGNGAPKAPDKSTVLEGITIEKDGLLIECGSKVIHVVNPVVVEGHRITEAEGAASALGGGVMMDVNANIIVLRSDASALTALLEEIAQLAGKVALGVLDCRLQIPDQLFALDTDNGSAAAGELIVRVKPSQALLRFAAAFRAWDGNGSVKVHDKSFSLVGDNPTKTDEAVESIRSLGGACA